ncbi:MarR family winged helix-turn-helix transcriptional regulator [Ornithinibacillus sp. 4-3]|uniref:MarR family winged helix-turn-helix transcriptional regulator n=1 Tax=Ornithinibacillus sp. 4-3 TaxID=3231488 RepID=A0AB39HQH8_9BACI
MPKATNLKRIVDKVVRKGKYFELKIQQDEISKIRRFNRFYLRVMGLTSFYVNESAYSVTEVLILFEIHNQPRCTATELVNFFLLDKGYISRVINNFERKNILKRVSFEHDRRIKSIELTEKGEEELAKLTKSSSSNISILINGLKQEELESVVAAMEKIEEVLTRIIRNGGE